MKAYEAKIARLDTGWLVSLDSINWGFTHHSDRSTLEVAIRQEIAMVTGDKDFYVALNFVG